MTGFGDRASEKITQEKMRGWVSPTPTGLVFMEEESISPQVCAYTGEGPCENRERMALSGQGG